MSEETKKQLTYADAGVNIDAGNEAVELMKASVQATYRPEVIGDIGGFGGLFALNSGKYKEPVLVSGTDGVGTKLKLAFMADKHDTIGQDAVAMCVNDILVQGAEPLFFLDYIAIELWKPKRLPRLLRRCQCLQRIRLRTDWRRNCRNERFVRQGRIRYCRLLRRRGRKKAK